MSCLKSCPRPCSMIRKNPIYFAVLVTLAIPLFGSLIATVSLAIVGIIRAEDLNPCATTNSSTLCSINDDYTYDENEFIKWLGGATACGFVFAIFCTVFLWTLENMVFHTLEPKVIWSKDEPDGVQLIEEGDTTPVESKYTPKPLRENHKIEVHKKERVQLYPFDKCAKVALFFTCLLFTFSMLCLLWAIAIAFNFSHRASKSVIPFVLVEILAAISCPLMLFISLVLLAILLDFLTHGTIDTRAAIPKFLKAVKFQQFNDGKKEDAWIIQGTFYFALPQRTEEQRKNCCTSVYHNCATWILLIIIGLSITLTVSHFADSIIGTQKSATSCNEVDRDFSCFNDTTLAYVDCVKNTNVKLIHCFKLHQFGFDNIISSVGSTFAFYLFVTNVLFGHVFLVMKILLDLTHNHCGGILFIFIGSVLTLVTSGAFLYWLVGFFSDAIKEVKKLNIINFLQFMMISLFVLLVGILMVQSKWVDLRKKNKATDGEKKQDTSESSGTTDGDREQGTSESQGTTVGEREQDISALA